MTSVTNLPFKPKMDEAVLDDDIKIEIIPYGNKNEDYIYIYNKNNYDIILKNKKNDYINSCKFINNKLINNNDIHNV
jgi:hypothetical protein